MLRDVLSHALRQTWRSRRVSVVIVATVAIAGAAESVLLAAAGSFLSVRIPGVDTDALAEAFHTYRGVRYAWSLPPVAPCAPASVQMHSVSTSPASALRASSGSSTT